MSPEKSSHPYYRYDFRGTLRLRVLDWLWLAFLGRHILFAVLLAAAQGKGGGTRIGANIGFLIEPWFMVADIPAVALLIAAANRVPKAGEAARFLWRNGRVVVALSVALYAGIFAWLMQSDEVTPDWIAWSSLALSFAIAAYAWFGRYPRDLWMSFPEREKAS